MIILPSYLTGCSRIIFTSEPWNVCKKLIHVFVTYRGPKKNAEFESTISQTYLFETRKQNPPASSEDITIIREVKHWAYTPPRHASPIGTNSIHEI